MSKCFYQNVLHSHTSVYCSTYTLYTPWGICYIGSMNHKKHAALSAHVSRVEGQLAAVRAALSVNDCSKAARTLLAASRSLASLRAACVSEFMSGQVYSNAPVKNKALLADVQSLMKA